MIKLLPLRLEFCEKVASIAEESLPESWSLPEIKNILNYGHNRYYVAIDCDEQMENGEMSECYPADRLVGFAGIMMVGDEAELLNIAVDVTHRRKGIGKRLLEKVLSEAKANDMSRMLLEVRESNESALHLYKQYGFTKLTVRKDYYNNPKENAIIMERRLIDF